MEQTLTCIGGHQWTREAKRGRPPVHCDRYPACTVEGSSDELTKPEETLPIIEHEPEHEPVVPPDMSVRENPFLKLKRSLPADNPAHGTTFIEKTFEFENPVTDVAAVTPSEEAEIAQSFFEPDEFHEKVIKKKSDELHAAFDRSRARQAVERGEFDWTIHDDVKHNHPDLTGIQIHDIHRDQDRKWTCKLTINGETFNCFRAGGWTIQVPEQYGGGIKHCLPIVAAGIQDYVRSLERNDPRSDEKKKPVTSESATAEMDDMKPKKRGRKPKTSPNPQPSNMSNQKEEEYSNA